MSLKEYVKKRNFEATPEPAPDEIVPKVKSTGRYFIQRHDATRLHYDFRLEIDGTLKSWAVPKGPTLSPDKKPLAMMVEDHPIDYGDFEGNIPKGNYGAGSVMLWDRGTFDLIGTESGQEQLDRGDLKFRLDGTKLKGTFAIVHMKNRGKGNEWLLIKKRDEYADPDYDVESLAWSVKTGRTQQEIAEGLPTKKVPKLTLKKSDADGSGPAAATRSAATEEDDGGPAKSTAKKKTGKVAGEKATAKKTASKKKTLNAVDPSKLAGARPAPMPQQIAPMMAHLADHPPEGPEWTYEIKWDGVRAICYLQNQRLRMVSRNGNEFDRQYPELSVVPNFIEADNAILDGEIAIIDEKGRSRFELIQPRIHQTDPNSISHLARKNPAKLFLFDLLYLDGYDLRDVQLADRKALLRQIVTPSEALHVSDDFAVRGAEMLEAARAHGLEGIMAKCLTSKYEPRRSRNWLKVKVTGRQEFVICGYTHGERDTFGSLVLCVHEHGGWRWVGNVGTGFDDKVLRDLLHRMQPLRIPKSPLIGNPAIGRTVTWIKPELVCEIKFLEWTRDGKLRAPVYMGLRPDKSATDVVREKPADESVASTETTRAAAKKQTAHPSAAEEAEPEQASKPATRHPGKTAKSSKKRVAGLAERPPLIPEDKKEMLVSVDGTEMKFGNLNKIFYPREGYTKRDVLNYYDAVADFILPHLKDRPLSLKRYPNGIHEPFFFQKNTRGAFPKFIRTEKIFSEHNQGPIEYALAEDRASLLYLANLGCIDQNPWMSRVQTIDCPDFVLIDLDPQQCPFEMIIEAMHLVKGKIDAAGLKGYPKTTGGDGMHIYIPVEPVYSYDQIRMFAELIWELVYDDNPKLFTTPRSVAKREKNRVYFDWMQIASSKTIAAPYVLRAYDGAPVATPLEWSEVKPGLQPHDFTIENAIQRFRKVGDLFRPVIDNPQRLEGALKKLGEHSQNRGNK